MAIDMITYEFLKRYVEGSVMGDNARPRGIWKQDPDDGKGPYKEGDYVTYNNVVYIWCNVNDSSAQNPEPGEDSTYWQRIAGITPEGIFSPDENNNLITEGNTFYGQNNVAFGSNNIVGCKGYRIKEITKGDTDTQYKYTLQLNDGETINYSNNDKVTIKLKNNYDYCGEIINITNNVITLEIYNKNNIPTTLYDGEIIGDLNSLRVPSKPEIGNIIVCNNNFACGSDNKAIGNYSYSEGMNNISAGRYSHTEGWQNTAVYAAHAEGNGSKALGQTSHAEGCRSEANGNNSHAEGYETKSNGYASHAEGQFAKADGAASHAEGYDTTTTSSAIYAHAEGYMSNSEGYSSHSEGYDTDAIGEASHAEGKESKALGAASHAEGYKTEIPAGGPYAHAEGELSQARGEASHAEGVGTVARGTAQHVQGIYNKKDYNGTYAHIVGNGTGTEDKDRKNIHTLDWEGNAWFAGKLYTGTNGTAYSDAFVTRNDVEKYIQTGLFPTDNKLPDGSLMVETPMQTLLSRIESLEQRIATLEANLS